MSLTIEKGKYYRTRAGEKTGPMRRTTANQRRIDGTQFEWAGAVNGDPKHVRTYRAAGQFFATGAEGASTHDLLAEWDDALHVDPDVVAGMKRAAEMAIEAILTGGVPCSASPPAPMTKTKLLETALQTVADRGVPYGGVEDNFARIAHLWNGYMTAHFADGAGGDTTIAVPQFKAVDVAAMMALMKLGRIAGNAGHMDSWIDLAGYAACGGEIAGKGA